MLNNATGFKKIYLATGFTDLRRGIEGLASIVKFQFNLDPYDKDRQLFHQWKDLHHNQVPE